MFNLINTHAVTQEAHTKRLSCFKKLLSVPMLGSGSSTEIFVNAVLSVHNVSSLKGVVHRELKLYPFTTHYQLSRKEKNSTQCKYNGSLSLHTALASWTQQFSIYLEMAMLVSCFQLKYPLQASSQEMCSCELLQVWQVHYSKLVNNLPTPKQHSTLKKYKQELIKIYVKIIALAMDNLVFITAQTFRVKPLFSVVCTSHSE